MYNGIGLTTPRGSGTSGYVQRNLSALRVHEKNNDKSSWDIAPPRHREPDEAILEHERKRKVEVKCLELRVELEDKEVDEVEIERRVDELRQKLLANLAAEANSALRAFKPSDTHAMAVAKKTELEKMARALGTRGDYQEGDAFDKEKQEEARKRRIVEREEREKERIEKAKRREEDRKRMEEQRKKWQEERRKRDEEEREKRRNRDDMDRDRNREDRERGAMPPPREPPLRDSNRELSRRSPPHRYGPRGDRRDAKDAPRRNDTSNVEAMRKRERGSPSLSRSRSRSPRPRARRRVRSRSSSTSRSASTDSLIRRRRSVSKSPSRLPQQRRNTDRDRADGGHRDLPPRRSPSPMSGVRRGGRPASRSVSPPSRSRSPPTRNARRRDYDDRSIRSRSRSPRVLSRPGPSGKGRRGYKSRTPSRSPTPPPPSRRERADQLPTTGSKDRQRGKERGRTRSRSVSSGSSMSVSSRSASGSRG